jgi:hypothetical protein
MHYCAIISPNNPKIKYGVIRKQFKKLFQDGVYKLKTAKCFLCDIAMRWKEQCTLYVTKIIYICIYAFHFQLYVNNEKLPPHAHLLKNSSIRSEYQTDRLYL